MTKDMEQPDANAALRILSNSDTSPFSPTAFRRLTQSIDDFIDALTAEAYRISRRARADNVSAAHVDEAVQHLINRRTKNLFKHIGTTGGILLGSGLSQLITMLSDSKFTPIGVSLTAALCVIGAFLVALHMAKE